MGRLYQDMKRFALMTVAALATSLLCQTAGAQEPTWLGDRDTREGAGFRVGDFELHPGIGVDFGYDSNYFRRNSSEDIIGALMLRVSPHFGVSTLGADRRGDDAPPPDVNFRFDVRATYNEFFPVSGSEGGQDLLQEQRNIGGDASVSLDILPGREWGGNINGGVGRTIRPTNEGDLAESFNRVTPHAGAELAWQPNSGLLDWRLGYEFSGTFFESSTFNNLNNFHNDITTRGRWRFLPRTALMYDARFTFITYPNPGGNDPKDDSHPLRSRIGINGLLTPGFGVLALVGYGASFYSNASATREDFDSLLAQAELKWYLGTASDPKTSLSSLSVGFIRDFEDSFVGTYLERDAGYVRFSYLFGGAFLLLTELRAGGVFFPANPQVGQGDGWSDFRLDGKLLAEYRVQDWLGITLDLNYTGYFSDTTLVFLNLPPPGNTDPLAYQQFRGFLGARVFF